MKRNETWLLLDISVGMSRRNVIAALVDRIELDLSSPPLALSSLFSAAHHHVEQKEDYTHALPEIDPSWQSPIDTHGRFDVPRSYLDCTTIA